MERTQYFLKKLIIITLCLGDFVAYECFTYYLILGWSHAYFQEKFY